MTDQEIAQLIYQEFVTKTLGVTEQYLEIHEPVYENGLPKISRIDRGDGDRVIAYLPVKGEYFFFAVYIDEKDRYVDSVDTLPRNIVSFIITSEYLSVKDLSSFTKLKPFKTWNKGDYKYTRNRGAVHKLNGIEFEPNPEPDEMENKLKKLLHYLHKDVKGVQALLEGANGFIRILMDFHRGNQHLGEAFIDRECITMLNDLKLEISFDYWAWGNSFK